MSQANVYRTGKFTDKKVIELLNALEKEFGCMNSSVHMGTLNVSYKDPENKSLFNNKNITSITRGDLQTPHQKFNVKFRRGICADVNNHETREPSAYFDEVIVVIGPEQPPHKKAPTPQEAVRCSEIVQKFVTNVIPEGIEDNANNATNLLQAQMAQLSSQYQDMLTGIDTRRGELDKEHDERTKLLKEQADARLLEIEEKRQKEEEKHQKKVEALDKREEALDNRNHMHVRRGLRENINEEIKSRLSKTIVPPSAQMMRWSVFLMALFAGGFLGYISYISIIELAKLASTPANFDKSLPMLTWFLATKTILSSLGAVGSLFYAISWLRQLYLDDVRTERELERYAYDINRASWAIETIMEMQTAKETDPPQRWIDAICSNLFEGQKDFNPIEALLNSSAKVEFGSDGAKFQLGSSGAKRLAKEIDNL